MKCVLALAAFFFLVQLASGKSRGCDGELILELQERTGYPWMSTVLEEYSARGSCATANCARRKARRNVRECADAVWANRWLTVPPNTPKIWDQCQSGNRVENFDMPNLKCRIFDKMCSMIKSQNRPEDEYNVAKIVLFTQGGTHDCYDYKRYSNSYRISDCSAEARGDVCFNN